jgi:hypothetical protein
MTNNQTNPKHQWMIHLRHGSAKRLADLH